jgi:hypothetical protein
MDIVVWPRGLGLEEYLKEIGVGPVGHRRILLDGIALCAALPV